MPERGERGAELRGARPPLSLGVAPFSDEEWAFFRDVQLPIEAVVLPDARPEAHWPADEVVLPGELSPPVDVVVLPCGPSSSSSSASTQPVHWLQGPLRESSLEDAEEASLRGWPFRLQGPGHGRERGTDESADSLMLFYVPEPIRGASQ